ncbi:helix-turn-helix domain-containing protein [Amycolatopsis alba]|uniref:XRE family transcriptional regulator n=1 Tax=Amycolatopsis alba DSM 44262 TaxID=1125972 RepID=A0A229RF49_AMYAL|nr:helix-turn-helix domain-containing protein [Amycolatopsis alba]OXM45044.1 XRE family transcriptional regulator [Amycolatopsis alba DSM 44262]
MEARSADSGDIADAEELGALIKRLRDEQRLTQDNVAGRAAKRGLRIRRERISEIENGRREPPTQGELRAILLGLGQTEETVKGLQGLLAGTTARPSEADVVEVAFAEPVRQPPSAPRRIGFGHRLLLVLSGAVAGVLIATGVAGVWPWTLVTYEADLTANVGRPNPADARGPCPQRSTDVRDHRDDTAGSVWYRECTDYLEIWVTDHMKDGRCVWAIVHWSNGVVDSSNRACPAGKMEFSKIAKYAPDFWMELVARQT